MSKAYQQKNEGELCSWKRETLKKEGPKQNSLCLLIESASKNLKIQIFAL